MEKEYIAFCGLICSECPVFIATKTNDDLLREQISKEYSTENFVITKDEVSCTGCHSMKGVNEKMCLECPMRKCGIKRKIEHCGECENYPCSIIDECVEKDSNNRKLLDKISFNG